MSLGSEELRARAHLNLVDSSRQLFELDPGAKIEAEQGWLFGAGRSTHPAVSNAAFRIDDQLDPMLLGAEIASLQASAMGRPVYAAMGYETIYDYRLLMSAPPRAADPG